MSALPKSISHYYDDDDCASTIIIDLEKLKKSLKIGENQNKATTRVNDGIALEFRLPIQPQTSTPRALEVVPNIKAKVILFDYNSTHFAEQMKKYPSCFEYCVIKSLDELNLALKNKTHQYIIFNYVENPKAINQLIFQIKQKFNHIKTIIAATYLSQEKVNQHKSTQFGADIYLDLNAIHEEIEKAID